MLDRHCLAYAALALVYAALTVILLMDGALPHAACALFAALIYAALCVSGTIQSHNPPAA
jgi:hypothetical protein